MNILRQRYGALMGLGLTVLLGAAIPFVEGGFRQLDDLARERLAGQAPVPAAMAPSLAPVTVATAPPPPPTIPLPENLAAPVLAAAEPEKEAPAPAPAPPKKAPLATKPANADGSVRELIVPEPPAGSARLIRVKEDVQIDLDGRPTIIRAGTVAPFKAVADGQVTFLANDHEISIDAEYVMFTGQSKERPEDITRLAFSEVIRRYPKLGEADSAEKLLFMVREKEFRLDPAMKDVFFADPKWPLILGEQLAEQEKWIRVDRQLPEDPVEGAETDKPAVPANELPAEAPNSLLPPNTPPIPQQSEPPPAR
jgi:hypothetical protein